MGKSTTASRKAAATRMHSIAVRERGACENCGESDYSKLQCAHIISRKYAATRVDLDNAFCLCATCHWHYTINPIEFARFTIKTIGDDAYDDLYRRAQQGVKTNMSYWEKKIEELRPT